MAVRARVHDRGQKVQELVLGGVAREVDPDHQGRLRGELEGQCDRVLGLGEVAAAVDAQQQARGQARRPAPEPPPAPARGPALPAPHLPLLLLFNKQPHHLQHDGNIATLAGPIAQRSRRGAELWQWWVCGGRVAGTWWAW